MCCGCMTHPCHVFQIQQNQKCHPTSCLFLEFDNKPILSHLANVITPSFPTKEIQDCVRLNLDSDKRMAIERVIAKLHVAPNLNSKVSNDDIDVMIDTFLKEFGHI